MTPTKGESQKMEATSARHRCIIFFSTNYNNDFFFFFSKSTLMVYYDFPTMKYRICDCSIVRKRFLEGSNFYNKFWLQTEWRSGEVLKFEFSMSNLLWCWYFFHPLSWDKIKKMLFFCHGFIFVARTLIDFFWVKLWLFARTTQNFAYIFLSWNSVCPHFSF